MVLLVGELLPLVSIDMPSIHPMLYSWGSLVYSIDEPLLLIRYENLAITIPKLHISA
jgi:hypothetical protein